MITSEQQQQWQRHQQQVLGLEKWQIQGRVGFYTEHEAWPGELNWQQNHQQYDVRIIASLGAGSIRIFTTEGGVMLENSSDPRPHFSPDPQALLKQQMGWDLPIDSLRYWVRGIPSPLEKDPGKWQLDASGRLANLQQAGWSIEFDRYKPNAGIVLPGKVLMEHKDLSVKIVIRKWQI